MWLWCVLSVLLIQGAILLWHWFYWRAQTKG
jgi:hypothetical protein